MENHDFTTEDPVEPTVGGQYDLCALTFEIGRASGRERV